jgi:hypothetical protein
VVFSVGIVVKNRRGSISAALGTVCYSGTFHDFSLVSSLTATATGTCANNFVANSGGLLRRRAGRGVCGRQSRQRAWTIRMAMTMKGAMI